MRAWYRTQEEIWYWLEQRASWLWLKLSKDRASYWLDWLPAYFLGHYYRNLNKRLRLERGKP